MNVNDEWFLSDHHSSICYQPKPTMHVSRSSSLSASSISFDARLGIFSSGASRSTDSCCTKGRPRRTKWSAWEDERGWERKQGAEVSWEEDMDARKRRRKREKRRCGWQVGRKVNREKRTILYRAKNHNLNKQKWHNWNSKMLNECA